MSSGRAVVSLSLNSTDREDAGNWTCTAQVYENITTGLTVGTPVERTIQLLVVGEPLSKVVCIYTVHVLYIHDTVCTHVQHKQWNVLFSQRKTEFKADIYIVYM